MRNKSRYVYGALVVALGVVLLLAGRGLGHLGRFDDANSPEVFVTFKPSTSYPTALGTLADLGLRLTFPCLRHTVPDAKPGVPAQWIQWESFDGQTNYALGNHEFWVTPTPLAPVDWQQELQTLPGVTKVDQGPFTLGCSTQTATPHPTPGVAYFVPPADVGTAARITFTRDVSYPTAVVNVLDLGLRLAAPCRERQQAQGTAGPWQPVGEERAFATSHTLVLATTIDSSTLWRQQLAALPGVTHVQAPYTASCS